MNAFSSIYTNYTKVVWSLLGSTALTIAQAQTPRPVPSAYDPNSKVNYVRTWEAQVPITNPNDLHTETPVEKARMTTQYVDGLGRHIQTVAKGGSLITGSTPTDMVAPVVYDPFGREAFKYQAYAAPESNGLFKLDPFGQQQAFYSGANSPIAGQGETFYYGEIKYEPSPLNRVEKTLAPGNSWAGNNRGIEAKYWINTAADEVRVWDVTDVANDFGTYASPRTYPAGELYKNVSVDEGGKQVIEFKDKEGKVILKKVQLTATADGGTGSNHTGWLCTYYLYDDFNLLRCVIQPKGVELLGANGWNMAALNGNILNEQCFRYAYDGKPRLILKKVPGAAPVYLVYDIRDRLVFSQDGNQRTQGKWLATLYDALNRPVLTGLINYSGTWTSLQEEVTKKTMACANSPTNGLATDLTLTATTSGTHQALRSVTLDEGFESSDNSEFVAEVLPGSSNGATAIVDGVEVNNNPLPDGTELYVLTQTGYDHYSTLPAGLSSSLVTSGYGSYFLSTYNVAPEYAQEVKASLATKGLVTWTKTRVLGSDQFLSAVSLYDDKARVIQIQTLNETGGLDIATTQYDFIGKVLRSHIKHQKAGNLPFTIDLATKNNYDVLGRVVKVEKNLNNTGWKAINELEYDALGQLKTKKLGAQALETLRFDYNIQGWLLGMNRDYVKDASNNYFGFELGYDKPNTIVSGATYAQQQYNGNIAGTIWKSKGDGEKRKYDYTYDAGNRLLGADFNQHTGGNFNKTAGVDFSVKLGDGINAPTAYDGNGNILAMQQKGLKLNSSPVIDQLNYSYLDNSNRLKGVTDAANDNQSKLEDFKYDAATKGSVDYGYDVNGNLVSDANKKITSIVYNHLNLPQTITVQGKGTIQYTYDATGNKLKKVTTDNTATPAKVTTTLYLAGGVYENDILQFIGHEDGRIRYQPAVAGTPASFQYDYFVKDHLGNIRMVLTEETKTDAYPVASMEMASAASEEALYNNLNATRVDKPAGYPNDTYTSPNDKVAKVRGDGQKIGPALTLKVMAGDKFNFRVNSWYKTGGATPNTPVNPLADLLTALTNGIGNVAGGKITATELSSTGILSPGAMQFLSNQPVVGSKPKAYVNWILFDEQFKYVSGSSGAEQVGNDEVFTTHIKNNLTIEKNGYLYIYVSNETPNIDVFFDNLQVSHIRGPLLTEDHYYPFGGRLAGISSKSFGGVENKKKYQQYEFNTDLDINLNESFYRLHDPQLGRFWQVDPKPNAILSPYTAMDNNPIKNTDFLGDTTYIYTMKGVYKGVIYDGLKTNEVVMLSNKNINKIVDWQKNGTYGNDELAEKVRGTDFASARITGNTIDALTSQWRGQGKNEGIGFLYVDPKTKEVQVSGCNDCGTSSSSASPEKLAKSYDAVAKKGQIIGVWHTHPPQSSFAGSQPTGSSTHDYTDPLYAMKGATFGVGMIVSKNTASIYPISNPVTQISMNRQDRLVTIPQFSKDFRGWQSASQYGVFNKNITPKTYWTQ